MAAGLELDLDRAARTLRQFDVDLVETGILRGAAGIEHSRWSPVHGHRWLDYRIVQSATAFGHAEAGAVKRDEFAWVSRQ